MEENCIIFKNAGEPWTKEEDEQLNKLYNVDMQNIIEISKIHNRPPGGIISRLCKNNHIPNRISARGYMIYKNSDMYKEIVFNGEKEKKERVEKKKKEKTEKENKDTLNIRKTEFFELIDVKRDIQQMKNEIVELKNVINGLSDMIKSIYEFETNT